MTKASSPRLSLVEMEAIAKKVTRQALEQYAPISPEEKANLTLGTGIDDDFGTFELYVATDPPQDAKIISCAKVNRHTGEVTIDVFLEKLPSL